MTTQIRPAGADDAALVLGFVRELATYEREPDAVEATPESLRDELASEHPPFECLIAELDGEPAGFALYFHNYSTWKGRRGIWLEDLFVSERFRRRGIGRALVAAVARIAVERGCGRFEWAVLNWNHAAMDFYASLGAAARGEWEIWRLSGEALAALGRETR